MNCSVAPRSCMCQVVELRMSSVGLHYESFDSLRVNFVKLARLVLQHKYFPPLTSRFRAAILPARHFTGTSNLEFFLVFLLYQLRSFAPRFVLCRACVDVPYFAKIELCRGANSAESGHTLHVRVGNG